MSSTTNSKFKVLFLAAALTVSVSGFAKDDSAKESDTHKHDVKVSKDAPKEDAPKKEVSKNEAKEEVSNVTNDEESPAPAPRPLSDHARETLQFLAANQIKHTVLYSNVATSVDGPREHYIILVGSTDGVAPPTSLPHMEAGGEADDASKQWTAGVHTALSVGFYALPTSLAVVKIPYFMKEEKLIDTTGFSSVAGTLILSSIYMNTEGAVGDTVDLHDTSNYLNYALSYPYILGYKRNSSAAKAAARKFHAELAEKMENEELGEEVVVVIKNNLFTAFKNRLTSSAYNVVPYNAGM